MIEEISLAILEETMYEAMRLAAVHIPPDVESRLQQALDEETDPLARQHLMLTLKNARLASEGEGLVCGDTGFPLFFVRSGGNTQVEGGWTTLWKAAQSATRRATEDSFLRPTMVDPLTRENPGTNVGAEMPKVKLEFDDSIEGLEIIAVPKGGGSEIFGTFYRMMYPSDGLVGVKKFVIESVCHACYAGKICPPAIVGVGIGGTADICMQIAKEAAVITPLGKRNDDPELAKLETSLFAAFRELGLGPMGSKGRNAVIALHIRTAVTHTAALPVAVNAQCSIGRRWKARITPMQDVTYTGNLND